MFIGGKHMGIYRGLIVALAAVAFGATVFAQVSPQAPAAAKHLKIVEGRVTKVEVTSPHVFLYINVTAPDDNDRPVTWIVQTGSPSELNAKGIKLANLRVGVVVRAEGTLLPGENRLEAPVTALSFPQ